jgi:adenylyl- and sulfurtransferase ThiI
MLARSVEGDVRILGARLWMMGSDADALADVAVHTFGVVSVSPCRKISTSLDGVCKVAAEIALRRPWTRFAIRAQREGTHEFRSQDVAIKGGSAVYKAAEAAGRTPKVDLDTPECEIHIDIRGGESYLFLDQMPGPGGIPAGSQGKIAVLLESDDDIVAAWLLARRGCNVKMHGKATPRQADTLRRWNLHTPGEKVGGSDRSAQLLALWERVKVRDVLAVADGAGLDAAPAPAGIPVLRPLAGLDQTMTAAMRRRVLGDA